MNFFIRTIWIIIIFLLIPFGVSNSQQGKGRMAGIKEGNNFNPATVVTIKAEVTDIIKTTLKTGPFCGIHLRVKTGNDNITVHLGPTCYIEKQEIKIYKNDKVEITGSKVKHNGEYVIIASVIKKNGKLLVLRDELGVPKWSGQRATAQY
ncbi:MAG: DNA-binding protein [Spirochaetes bacterium]|jgi:hypothetical protein|nr:DNA-binding protein [Spirochaetota bacterium]